jgi:tRNA nucleotidyltransferase (CCA-adding enzyme)
MPDKKKREKVVAEITLAHLTRVAVETGRPLTEEQAINFLNQEGRAYAMWTRMMQAGEEYIKTTLRQSSPALVTRPANGRRLVI